MWCSIMQLAGVLTAMALITQVEGSCMNHTCLAGQSCWPSTQEWTTLSGTVSGDFVWPSDANYNSLNIMHNGRVKKKPAVIIFVNSADDVKKCIVFATSFNIRVSIMSSGHSFIGRSTHDGSMLINMSKLKDVQINTAATARSQGGEITVQTGNTWAKVYKELDDHNRIAVGGSAHTVAMGGYTLGGGHSPVSRSLGLAVDNLLEVQMVTAEGHLVTVSADGIVNHDTGVNSTDTDLFWALRGGGGGTWGVVISFTFKLHIPPTSFVQYLAGYAMYYNGILYGENSLRNVLDLMANLPKEWGGYIVMSTESDVPGVRGGFLLSLLHYGPTEAASFKAIEPLHSDTNAGWKFFINKTSFWDYSKNTTDPDGSAYRSYIVNSLIKPGISSAGLARVIREEMFKPKYAASGCTFTMLGGKMEDAVSSDTPINPGFRSAAYSLSCGHTWTVQALDCENIKLADRFNTRLQEFGNGVYFNEPAEYLENWKTAFWGNVDTYNKLLNAKRKYDSCNFFRCHNCVGFDLNIGQGDPNDETQVCSAGTLKIGTVFVIVLFHIASLI